MPRVIHFEISADDPERASKFYEAVFGWKIEKYAGPMEYWLATTGPDDRPGINGAIMRRPDPGTTTVNSIDVPSFDAYAARVTASGGKVYAQDSYPGRGLLCLLPGHGGQYLRHHRGRPVSKVAAAAKHQIVLCSCHRRSVIVSEN